MGIVSRVLEEVWGQREGYVFFPHRKDGVWHEQDRGYRWTGKVEGIHVDTSADVYWCPLVFDRRRRLAAHALPTHVLWADLDAASPYECRLRPSVAWQTTQGVSGNNGGGYDPDPDVAQYMHQAAVLGAGLDPQPHYQALWLLWPSAADFSYPEFRPELWSIPAAEAAQLSKRIAHAEPGADKGGWDVTQVLRLPGTLNHKHTPPHRVELLWAERRYYTVAQVEAAYPPVAADRKKMNGHADAGEWTDFTPAEVAEALQGLPVGVQVALERGDAGADRSLELLRLARTMLRLSVPPSIIPHLLRGSALNKFKGRANERQCLLKVVDDAML